MTGALGPNYTTSAPAITLTHMPRHISTLTLTVDEVKTLADAGNYKTLDMSLFSLTFGVALTIGITLATVDTMTDRTASIFWACLLVSVLASVHYGVRALIAWRSSKAIVERFTQSASVNPTP